MKKSIEDYKKESLEFYKRQRPPVAQTVATQTTPYENMSIAEISAAEEKENGEGGLVVITTRSRGLFPVENAKISVYNPNTTLITELLTDRNGKTDRIALSAPKRSNSQNPGNSPNDVASFYNVKVESEGYVPILLENIPVFDGVTSLQKVDLQSSSTSNGNGMQIIDFPKQDNL